MQEADIRRITAIILDEQEERLRRHEDALIARAVVASLAVWGADASDPEELRELKLDRVHNRWWRKNVEVGRVAALRAFMGTVCLGILGAIWVGLVDKIKH